LTLIYLIFMLVSILYFAHLSFTATFQIEVSESKEMASKFQSSLVVPTQMLRAPNTSFGFAGLAFLYQPSHQCRFDVPAAKEYRWTTAIQPWFWLCCCLPRRRKLFSLSAGSPGPLVGPSAVGSPSFDGAARWATLLALAMALSPRCSAPCVEGVRVPGEASGVSPSTCWSSPRH